MIQIKPGDVVAFELKSKYYYAIILTKIIMFGGNLVYAFQFETKKLLSLEELLDHKTKGFNSIVDFIFAKRQKRLVKLGHLENYSKYRWHRYFKGCNEINTKSDNWFIYDENNKMVKRTSKLTDEEKSYPFWSRIDDTILVGYIKDRWLPELDIRV